MFKTIGCAGCHTITGQSVGTNGPDLLQALSVRHPSRAWLKAQIMSPNQHYANTSMPSYSYLHKDQIDALINFLQTLGSRPYPPPAQIKSLEGQADQPVVINQNTGAPAAETVGEWEHGKVLFNQSCMVCHNPSNPKSPSLRPIRGGLYSSHADDFAARIDPIIQHGAPSGMPAFASRLSQAQIADIEAYVLHLNGVDRDQVLNPGIAPRAFLYIVIGLLVLVIIGALVLRQFM